MSNIGLSIEASFDRQLVKERGGSVRYLVIDIEVPESQQEEEAIPELPLNVALVVDASSSMAGKRIACAKEAAIGVVNALSPSSRLSFVSFARQVETHFFNISLEANEREAALSAIQSLWPRDNTNLGAGWLKGASCVAEIMERYPKMHHHVVVLSDGHANAGIVDPMVLGHHSQELRQRGIITSCVGVGDNYSSDQLQALTESGGGQLHDAQFPHEMIEVVIGELKEVQETFIKDIALKLTLPSDVRVENLSGFHTELSSRNAVVQLGMLAPGRKRHVIFRITAPEGRKDERLIVESKVSWTDLRTSQSCEAKPSSSILTFASEIDCMRESSDANLKLRVAETWQAGVVRKCVRLNRLGELRELGRFLENEIKYLSRYCHGLHRAQRLVLELQGLRERADRMWDERSRKTMDHSTYLQTQTYFDYRSLTRGGWSDTLDNL